MTLRETVTRPRVTRLPVAPGLPRSQRPDDPARAAAVERPWWVRWIVPVVVLLGIFISGFGVGPGALLQPSVGDRLGNFSVATLGFAGIVAVVVVWWFGWKRPIVGIPLVLVVGIQFGGSAIVLAAPLVILLARIDTGRSQQMPRTIKRTIGGLGMALAAFLVSLLFSNLFVGGGSGSGSRSGNSARPYSQPGGESSAVAQLVERAAEALRRLLGLDGDPGDPGDPGDAAESADLDGTAPVRPPEPDPDPDIPWRILLALLVMLLLIALSIWLYRRLRKPEPDGRDANASLFERLESLGASLGRERRRDEAVLRYAERLETDTGDTRLTGLGEEVSRAVYESPAADSTRADSSLGRVEANPPAAPVDPPRKRRLRMPGRDTDSSTAGE